MSTFLTSGALLETTAVVNTSAFPYILTPSSATILVVQGSDPQVIVLPRADRLREGVRFFIANRSSSTVEVQYSDGSTLCYINTNEQSELRCKAAGTENGQWDFWSSFMAKPSGFPDVAQSTLTFDDMTRTLTITPTGDFVDYYVSGVQYRFKDPLSIQIDDISGTYYVLINDFGALLFVTTLDLSVYRDFAYIALIYWNFDSQKATLVLDQRHSHLMESSTKYYLQRTEGAKWVSGLIAGNYSFTGLGSADTDAQISFANGVITNQDLEYSIEDGFPQELSPISQIPILYREGMDGVWNVSTATNFPLISGMSRARYNRLDMGVWSLEDAPIDNLFFMVYIFATGDIRHPLIGVLGQRTDTTLDNAREGNVYTSFEFGDLPIQDMRVIYRLAFVTSSTFGNAPKAILKEALDLRLSSPGAGGTGTVSLKDGGLEFLTDTTDTTYTVPPGRVNMHLFMHVLTGHTLTVDNGARLVSSDDTIDGTVVVNPGGIWKVL